MSEQTKCVHVCISKSRGSVWGMLPQEKFKNRPRCYASCPLRGDRDTFRPICISVDVAVEISSCTHR